MTPLRGSEIAILSACCFLTAFSPLHQVAAWVEFPREYTGSLAAALMPGAIARPGDPAGMQQAWCFWKALDLPCARCSGRANMCLEFPDLLLPLKGPGWGEPHDTFHPDNQALRDLA